jgi:hypothetical protein
LKGEEEGEMEIHCHATVTYKGISGEIVDHILPLYTDDPDVEYNGDEYGTLKDNILPVCLYIGYVEIEDICFELRGVKILSSEDGIAHEIEVDEIEMIEQPDDVMAWMFRK